MAYLLSTIFKNTLSGYVENQSDITDKFLKIHLSNWVLLSEYTRIRLIKIRLEFDFTINSRKLTTWYSHCKRSNHENSRSQIFVIERYSSASFLYQRQTSSSLPLD